MWPQLGWPRVSCGKLYKLHISRVTCVSNKQPHKLLACALACLANPYRPNGTHLVATDSGDSPSTRAPAIEGTSSGDIYFAAAMRRLGLLSNSLISIQCHYFAGLYQKFSIRPLSAWTLLQQASVRFQAYLYAKALSGNGSDVAKSAPHIEQRLYWSCVKAEWYVIRSLHIRQPTRNLTMAHSF